MLTETRKAAVCRQCGMDNGPADRTLNVRVLLHGFSGSFPGLIVLHDKTDLSPITTL
jgi:hypothetical protein